MLNLHSWEIFNMFAPESSLTSANPFRLNFFTTTLCVSPEDCKQIAQDL
jgi:hypothetical protein